MLDTPCSDRNATAPPCQGHHAVAGVSQSEGTVEVRWEESVSEIGAVGGRPRSDAAFACSGGLQQHTAGSAGGDVNDGVDVQGDGVCQVDTGSSQAGRCCVVNGRVAFDGDVDLVGHLAEQVEGVVPCRQRNGPGVAAFVRGFRGVGQEVGHSVVTHVGQNGQFVRGREGGRLAVGQIERGHLVHAKRSGKDLRAAFGQLNVNRSEWHGQTGRDGEADAFNRSLERVVVRSVGAKSEVGDANGFHEALRMSNLKLVIKVEGASRSQAHVLHPRGRVPHSSSQTVPG